MIYSISNEYDFCDSLRLKSFADALAFRRRSLVLRKAQRILAFLVLKITCSLLHTGSALHALRKRSVGILGGETAKQNLPSVRVARRNKTLRPCVKNTCSAFLHAVLHMHRRCVGFSLASPSVTKRATHPGVPSVESTCLARRRRNLQRLTMIKS